MRKQVGPYRDYKEMIDKKAIIGWVKITGKYEIRKYGQYWLECLCKCGNTFYKRFGDLNKLNTKNLSCKCKHRQIVRELGYKNKKYYLNVKKLIDSPEISYINGLLASDGFHTHNNLIGISLVEEISDPLINRVKEYIEYTGPVKSVSNYKTKEGYIKRILTISDRDFIKFFNENGIIVDKTKNYEVPQQFLKNSNFWRGFIDGDGCFFSCLSKGDWYYGISLCGTKQAMESFKYYCEFILQLKLKIKVLDKKNIFTFAITGKKSLKIMESLYTENSLTNYLYMNRKYKKQLQIREHFSGDIKPCINKEII